MSRISPDLDRRSKISGAQVKMPPTHGAFKKADRVKKEDAKQAGLGI